MLRGCQQKLAGIRRGLQDYVGVDRRCEGLVGERMSREYRRVSWGAVAMIGPSPTNAVCSFNLFTG